MHRPARSFLVILSLTLLVLVGCSSDDDESSESSNTTLPAGVVLEGKVNNHGSAPAKDGLEVELDNFYFGPTFIKATTNQSFKVKLMNEGSVAHTFTSDTLGIDEEVAPGASKEVTLTAPPSRFSGWYCKFHQGQGMQGAVFVG